MAKIKVSEERNILDENSRTFEERKEELLAYDRLSNRGWSPYARYTQKNLERTKELVWLALNQPAAMAIFTVFEDRMDKRNGVVCSNRTLCELLGVSDRTVNRAIAVLRERNFITVLKTGRENVYAVNHSICWKNSGKKMWMSRFTADVILSLSEQEKELRDLVEEAGAETNEVLLL